MGFESLKHTPGFELPDSGSNAPADLISIIEECHKGLSKAVVSKMVRRGKYEQVASVICQDNATKNTAPTASAEDIADYCMMCMQYEAEKSDDPGTYKVTLYGPSGRGRFERSKHVDLSGGDGEARSTTLQTEGELIEQQSQYIGELHSQNVTLCETMNSMVIPLLKENKEMMKIVSDSQRKLAEIERDRMNHDLQLKLHQDDIKMEEAKEEMKNERWKETMEVVKESGAIEGFMKAIMRKMNGRKEEEDDDDDDDDDKSSEKSSTKKKKSGPVAAIEQVKKKKKAKKKRGASLVEKAKKKDGKPKKKKPKTKLKAETEQKISDGEELSQEEVEEVFSNSAMEKIKDNPLSVLVEVFRMTIDENEQWEIVEETLTKEQFKLFKRILNTDNDKKITSRLRKLYELQHSKKFLELEEHLDEKQQGYIDKLLEVAMS